MKNWKAVAGVILVFLLGGVCGAALAHKVGHHWSDESRHGRDRSEFIVKRMSRELDLDDSQREEVRKIITGAHNEMQALMKQTEPQRDAIISRSEDQVRAILKPEQKERFEKFVEKMKQRRMEHQ